MTSNDGFTFCLGNHLVLVTHFSGDLHTLSDCIHHVHKHCQQWNIQQKRQPKCVQCCKTFETVIIVTKQKNNRKFNSENWIVANTILVISNINKHESTLDTFEQRPKSPVSISNVFWAVPCIVFCRSIVTGKNLKNESN